MSGCNSGDYYNSPRMPILKAVSKWFYAASALIVVNSTLDAALLTIRIENSANGRIQAKTASADKYITIGSVLQPATATVSSFPAAAYVPGSSVAAVATHGIRIRVPSRSPLPISISVQPFEFRHIPDSGYGGHIPGRSAIVTDISAGKTIFRELSPLVGDRVLLETSKGLVALSNDWQPSEGDVIIIECQPATEQPKYIEFENRLGGLVRAHYGDGKTKTLGKVTRPISGVGRFDGTGYTGPGAVNTNHGGVITVSTAPLSRPADEGSGPETRGGFSIHPSIHSGTQPVMPQAMTVAPFDNANAIEGTSPLFYGTIHLGIGEAVTQAKFGNGDWEPLPVITGKSDDAFTAEGLRRLGFAKSGGLTALRLTIPERSEQFLAQAISSAARAPIPSKGSGEPAPIEWSLRQPYPAGAAYVVFRSSGRTLAISNSKPFRFSGKVLESTGALTAEVFNADGISLETRTARVIHRNGASSALEQLSTHQRAY